MRKKEEGKERGASERGGDMTVQEAGHRGGQKGGERVRELIEEGKEKEREGTPGHERR